MTRILLFLLAIGSAHAETSAEPIQDRSWHLLQKQYDGLIRSVEHGLTKHECEFAAARAMGRPATDEEKATVQRANDIAESDWRKWADGHHCTHGYGATSGLSSVANDGRCYRGEEFNSFGSGMKSINMTDIGSAECFQ